jgi:hypothetical protein
MFICIPILSHPRPDSAPYKRKSASKASVSIFGHAKGWQKPPLLYNKAKKADETAKLKIKFIFILWYGFVYLRSKCT